MANKKMLTIGSKFQFDGEVWKVEGFIGGDLKIRSTRGKPATFAIAELIGAPGFAFLDQDERGDEHEETATFPENASKESIRSAQLLLEHLNEIETGYKSGYLGTAAKHEPVPAYDIHETTYSQRLEAKALELGVTTRTLWKQKAAYRASGIYGLLDQRQIRLSSSKIDVRIIEALHFVVESLVDKSNVTNQFIVRRIKKRLLATNPENDVEIPSESTFNRLIARETKNKGLRGSAKGRRSINNSPETTYRRFHATRPGEMVLIDSTPLDAFAMDPVSFRWIQVQLTIALDLYTRSIVAWRFTPVSTKGVDAALLLHDIIRPKMMLKGWPESARWTYVGVPEYIVIEISENSSEYGIAGVPILQPDTIVIDQGKVFISQAFKDACVRLGTNLQLARPYTPTDKAHVERMFRTIRENFVMELPGYKGPDVYSRGLDPEGEAFYFLDEIAEKFAEWVASWWQRRHHGGLDLPDLPLINMSPNEMYNEGIARAGFVHMVSTENMYYELLPTTWRNIHSYGIDFRNLRYDGEILNDFRHQQSPYIGVNKGKWPVRYDPRDLSFVYFYDHELHAWHKLSWIHAEGTDRPFNESVLGYAKALVITREGNPGNADEIAETLNNILDGMYVSTEDRRLRKVIAVNAIHAQLAKNDQPAERSDVTEPDSEADFTDNGILTHAPRTATDSTETDNSVRPILDVDQAMEDDDDDLGYL